MTPHEKSKSLIERLYVRTEGKKIDWTGGPQGVSAKLAGRIVALSVERNGQGEPLETVTILDDFSSETIDTFNDEMFSGDVPDHPEFNGFYTLMATTREMAIRQAAGADEALDDILSALADRDEPDW